MGGGRWWPVLTWGQAQPQVQKALQSFADESLQAPCRPGRYTVGIVRYTEHYQTISHHSVIDIGETKYIKYYHINNNNNKSKTNNKW